MVSLCGMEFHTQVPKSVRKVRRSAPVPKEEVSVADAVAIGEPVIDQPAAAVPPPPAKAAEDVVPAIDISCSAPPAKAERRGGCFKLLFVMLVLFVGSQVVLTYLYTPNIDTPPKPRAEVEVATALAASQPGAVTIPTATQEDKDMMLYEHSQRINQMEQYMKGTMQVMYSMMAFVQNGGAAGGTHMELPMGDASIDASDALVSIP